MGTLIVSNIVSLDGCYAAADGNPLVLDMDAAFDAYNLERIRAAGTVLLGRRSYEMFSSYWPHVAGAPDDPGNRQFSEDNRELSRVYGAIPKVVVSDTWAPAADNPWYGTTTVVGRAEVAAHLAREAPADRDVLVFGSRTAWQGWLAEGLVDEIHLMVSPVVVGDGIPVLPPSTRLTLLGARTFPGSGNVLHRYAPA